MLGLKITLQLNWHYKTVLKYSVLNDTIKKLLAFIR